MLINCVAYQHGKRIAEPTIEEISDFVARPDCFVWVALKDATAEEFAWIKREFNIHELAIEDAAHGHQRPKIEGEYGEDLFVVVHLLEEVKSKTKPHVGEVNIFAGPNYVISICNHCNQDLTSAHSHCESNPHLLAKGSGYVLYAIMDTIVDRYFPLLEKLDTELEVLEERMFNKGAANSNIRRFYRLKRRTAQIRHAVYPLMEATSRLQGGTRIPTVCDTTRAYFRDVYDHLVRINSELESIRDTISTAIQVSLSMVAIEQSENSKKLAAWAGIFAVPTAFAGIWGMNFEMMPELHQPWGYPFALTLIVTSCLLLYRQFKKVKWL